MSLIVSNLNQTSIHLFTYSFQVKTHGFDIISTLNLMQTAYQKEFFFILAPTVDSIKFAFMVETVLDGVKTSWIRIVLPITTVIRSPYFKTVS